MYKTSAITDINHNSIIATTSTDTTTVTDMEKSAHTDIHAVTLEEDMDEETYEEEKLQQQLAIEWLDRRIHLARAQALHMDRKTKRYTLQRQRRAVTKGHHGQRFVFQLRLATMSGMGLTYKCLLDILCAEKKRRVLALIDFQFQYASRLAAQVKADRRQVHTAQSPISSGLARSVE